MTEAIRQGDIPGVQLRHRQALSISVDEAWEWLTRPEKLERWAADGVSLAGPEGADVRLESPDVTEEGETLERSAPRVWVLAFRRLDGDWRAATRLTFELHPTAEGCELDVFHEGFEHLSLSSCLTVWESYRKRWREAAARLGDLTAQTF